MFVRLPCIKSALKTVSKSHINHTASTKNSIPSLIYSRKQLRPYATTMSTSSKIHLSPAPEAQFYLEGITADSAKTATDLLQRNHDEFHIFFNQSGFHNHIVHHLLTIFALNASPAELRRGYAENASYQRPPVPLEKKVVEDMSRPESFKKYLGNEKYYHDFLVFFQNEMDVKGWENVVNEYVFKGDERADDMLVRLFSGFLHPIIHLGFGIEFKQPAIVAEALAQTAVHGNWIGPLFLKMEKAAATISQNQRTKKSVGQLLNEIKADKKLSSAAHFADDNKIRDGILKRAPEEMIKYASQYSVAEHELEEKTAEMINLNVYFSGAAQHPPSQVKFDFFFIHCVNCSIFFPTFLRQTWLSSASKRRLLEWKVRCDLTMYASRGSPTLDVSEISNYAPESGKQDSWQGIFERVRRLSEDGHASKLVRALANGEKVCRKWEDKDNFVIKGDMWKKLGNMAIDSVEAGGPNWVRSCGFEEAWKSIPDRKSARL